MCGETGDTSHARNDAMANVTAPARDQRLLPGRVAWVLRALPAAWVLRASMLHIRGGGSKEGRGCGGKKAPGVILRPNANCASQLCGATDP